MNTMNSKPVCVAAGAAPSHSTRSLQRMGRVAVVLAFAIATGLAAHVQVLRPDSPVPHTMQTLVVVLAGMLLGARYGALSMAAYLMLGATGHFVFALNAAPLGFAYLLGPTGGYLLGFLLAQPVLGLISRPALVSRRCGLTARVGGLTAAVVAGHLVILTLGVAWLRVWAAGSWSAALGAGFWPFLGDAIVKSALAVAVCLAIGPVVRRRFE